MLVCFNGLDTFGKTPDQIGDTVKLFLLTLADYPAILVRKAFEKWVRSETKIPTPAHIIALVEEDNARLLDFVDYVRNGGFITASAEDYVIEKLGRNWRGVYV